MIAGNPLAGPCPYDVGDILQTANAANPSTRWPGTEWAAITTFLLGASAAHPAGETGGAEKHTLSENEMPTHNHSMQPDHYLVSWGTGAAQFGTIVSSTTWGQAQAYTESQWGGYGADASNQFAADQGQTLTTDTGGGQPHNNMPPYTSVYIWQRTA